MYWRGKRGLRGTCRNGPGLLLLVCLFVTVLAGSCTDSPLPDRKPRRRLGRVRAVPAVKSKVLYVNSYHRGYEWSDAITKGILDTFGARLDRDGGVDNSDSRVILKIVYMDTKRNKSEAFKKAAALKVREMIAAWRPDVVIASDDNAAKYLIVPYLMDTGIPVVFCGLNMDASVYGFPSATVTGMVEVFPVIQLLAIMKPYAVKARICALAADTLSEHKALELIEKEYRLDIDATFVNTFGELRKAYIDSQQKCGMLLFFELLSVKGFDHHELLKLVAEKARIPSGALDSFNREYVLVTCANKGEEQGEWAARAALAILKGRAPADIPMATNRKARVYLNMSMAKRLGIRFPIELIDRADFVGEKFF